MNPLLRFIENADHYYSSKLAVGTDSNGVGRFILLSMEWSMHGVPWLALTIMMCLYNDYLFESPSKYHKVPYLLLFALVLDLIFVGVIKMAFRRARPIYNKSEDQFYDAPVADKYSFPSGHTSRSAMLCVLAYVLFKPNGLIFGAILLNFPIVLGMSRIIMGRHFILDVVGGFILGITESIIVTKIGDSFIHSTKNYINELFM